MPREVEAVQLIAENRRPYRALSEPGDEWVVTHAVLDGSGRKTRYTLRQVGWHGQSGAFYSLAEDPKPYERGSWSPLWVIAHTDELDDEPAAQSLMDDLPPEVRPVAVAVGIADRPVDVRERASEWITGFLAATDDDRVNCVALMLGAADDAIRCAVNHHEQG